MSLPATPQTTPRATARTSAPGGIVMALLAVVVVAMAHLSATPVAAQARGGNDDLVEVTFWNTVKDTLDPRDLRDYLARYPNGNFATLARRRIDRLEGRPAVPDPAPEAPPAAPERAAADKPPAAPAGTMRRLVRHYVEGEGYDTTDDSSFDLCVSRCLTDSRCQMMEFYKPKRKCNLFDHRKALKTSDNDADVALKSSPE